MCRSVSTGTEKQRYYTTTCGPRGRRLILRFWAAGSRSKVIIQSAFIPMVYSLRRLQGIGERKKQLVGSRAREREYIRCLAVRSSHPVSIMRSMGPTSGQDSAPSTLGLTSCFFGDIRFDRSSQALSERHSQGFVPSPPQETRPRVSNISHDHIALHYTMPAP